MRKNHLIIGFILGLMLVTGCAAMERADIASRAQEELIGMKRSDLLSCAGVPERQAQADDGMEFFTYSGGGDSVGVGIASSRSTTVFKNYRRYCVVTFILKNGIVQKVNYQGRTGGLISSGEQCAFVVENCLKGEDHQNRGSFRERPSVVQSFP